MTFCGNDISVDFSENYPILLKINRSTEIISRRARQFERKKK